jgi:hypothetical protein
LRYYGKSGFTPIMGLLFWLYIAIGISLARQIPQLGFFQPTDTDVDCFFQYGILFSALVLIYVPVGLAVMIIMPDTFRTGIRGARRRALQSLRLARLKSSELLIIRAVGDEALSVLGGTRILLWVAGYLSFWLDKAYFFAEWLSGGGWPARIWWRRIVLCCLIIVSTAALVAVIVATIWHNRDIAIAGGLISVALGLAIPGVYTAAESLPSVIIELIRRQDLNLHCQLRQPGPQSAYHPGQ